MSEVIERLARVETKIDTLIEALKVHVVEDNTAHNRITSLEKKQAWLAGVGTSLVTGLTLVIGWLGMK